MSKTEHAKVVLTGLIRPNEGDWPPEARRFGSIPVGPQELIDDLAAHWIRYTECHHCGWFSHCPYPQRVPDQPHRARDIQCGIALRALTNFVQCWWNAFVQMNDAQRQHFLDALFWWTDYVSEAVFSLSRISDVDHLAWCGAELAALTMTEPKRLRRSLDQFSFHIARTGQAVLEETFALVEGESEAAFLETLIELRFFSSEILGVAPYHGKGNAKASKLPAADLERRGVLPVVQVDADRSARSYEDLKGHLAAHSGVMFKFSSDFEGAFPAEFLSAALEELGHVVDVAWLSEQLAPSRRGPVLRAVEQKLGVSINKPALARQLAYITRAHWASLARRLPTCEIVLWISQLENRRPRSERND